MELLTFSVGRQRLAVEASRVSAVVHDREAAAEAHHLLDLREMVPGALGSAEPKAWVLVAAGDRTLALATGLPEGFRGVDASRLMPVPGYLFEGARRLVRCVFEDEGHPRMVLETTAVVEWAEVRCT